MKVTDILTTYDQEYYRLDDGTWTTRTPDGSFQHVAADNPRLIAELRDFPLKKFRLMALGYDASGWVGAREFTVKVYDTLKEALEAQSRVEEIVHEVDGGTLRHWKVEGIGFDSPHTWIVECY